MGMLRRRSVIVVDFLERVQRNDAALEGRDITNALRVSMFISTLITLRVTCYIAVWLLPSDFICIVLH